MSRLARCLIPVVCLVLAGAATAATYTLGDTLTTIQMPLPNIPSLILPGQMLEIQCEAPLGTTGWTAALRRDGLDIPLTLSSAGYDASTLWWTLTATVPVPPVYELYDLRVTASGGIDDTARRAVKVLPAFRQDFCWVQITDTHLPTYLYYYQSGADSDSTNAMGFREICRDVNLINPDFVLHTGDFIHEGELEDYLGKRYYSRAQAQLNEFEVPTFLVAGNHDIGGWNDTPPSDGTARRDWWRFFGWKRLDSPPPGAPAYTQDYGFDYGPVHFIGLEAYDNYDSWRFSTYGYESFTAQQMNWLQAEAAGAAQSEAIVLFHHHDFAGELNLSNLGIDMALSGHTHRDTEDGTPPYEIVTDNAGSNNRPFRLIHWRDGNLDARPTIGAGSDGGNLTVNWWPANDGTRDLVRATLDNNNPEGFPHALVKVRMPGDAPGFLVGGGTLTQVDQTGDDSICYVEVDLAAYATAVVTVQVDPSIDADTPSGAPRLFGATPNPFNPRTEVRFDLPTAGRCRLTVFDLRGREVAVLADGFREAGVHALAWDGTNDAGEALPSGVYFAGLKAGRFAQTRKMTLAR